MNSLKLALLLAVAATVAGCNGEAEQAVAMRRSNLAKVGLGYHMYYEAKGQGPSDVEEFAEYLLQASPDDPLVASAVESLRNGDIVMIWNAVLDQDVDLDAYTLGFEASAPRGGGYIVTGGGRVEMVTSKKFHEKPIMAVAKPLANRSEPAVVDDSQPESEPQD